MNVPIAVTIAGSDSSGGAGIQADIKAFSANDAYGASIITALTAQNTRGVQAIHDVPAEFITKQIDSVFSDLDVGATKIGMLSRSETIAVVVEGLKRYAAENIVVDPVMVSTSGDRLLQPDAIDALKRQLFPMAAIITPNLQEAAALLDQPIATNETEMLAQGKALLQFGAAAVLIKGGHGDGPEAVDLLITPAGALRYSAPRIVTKNTHGTGCTLAAAIAANLAAGDELNDAVRIAKNYVHGAIAKADGMEVGEGNGPIHHFYEWW